DRERSRGGRGRGGRGMSTEQEKDRAAQVAAGFVEEGMRVGLGTGSTVAFLLRALAARRLDVRCVSTSPATEKAARDLGMSIEPFSGTAALSRLDIAIDGADQGGAWGLAREGGGGGGA